jgi:uncharacterized membrane protein
MSDPDITPGRLEAISDGIFAIIITIMVLELRPPSAPDWRALLATWPDFLSYLVSFTSVATFWVNHRHIIRRLPALRERIVWMNILLLFLISLIPVFTAYMGRSGLAPFPMAVYAGVVAICGVAFGMLRAMVATEIADPARRRQFNGPSVQAIGAVTLLILLAASALSFASPPGAGFDLRILAAAHRPFHAQGLRIRASRTTTVAAPRSQRRQRSLTAPPCAHIV